jgi:membrane protease YdiL (CAAX protease family)
MPLRWNKRTVVTVTQRNPALRSLLYLGLMVASTRIGLAFRRDKDDPYYHVYVPTFPLVVGITHAFARLDRDTYSVWQRGPTSVEVQDGVKGFLAGAGSVGVVVGIAAIKGWVSAPQWGWQVESGTIVDTCLAVMLRTGQLVLTVYNEEMVFRGYGLDSLRAAVGLPAAVATLSILFAMSHGKRLNLKQWGYFILGGVMFSLLRLEQGHLWGAAGYHYGWNLVQVACCRPLEKGLSLRPLHVHSGQAWIGRPGNPDPGWLHILAFAVMTLIVSLRLWRRIQQRR